MQLLQNQTRRLQSVSMMHPTITRSFSSSLRPHHQLDPFFSRLQHKYLFNTHCFIDGRWTAASNAATLPVYNPSNGALIGEVPQMTLEDVKSAIDSNKRAFSSWSQTHPSERSRLMRDWFELLLLHRDDLATILTSEQGKPHTEAVTEILYAASFIEVFAEECKRLRGEILPGAAMNSRVIIEWQPVGVCAAITPWNFPVAMFTRKIGAALAAGCPITLKPSELTPFSAFAVAELAKRARIPDGVINMITGDAKMIGEELCSNPIVRKISFTGSTRVGKLLMQQSTEQLKRLSLELGGNAPFIIFDDADLDKAVQGAIVNKFRNAGQTCVCANRIFVQRGIYERYIEKLKEAMMKMPVGNGFAPGVKIGPLINQSAVDKVLLHVEDAVKKGGKLLLGGYGIIDETSEKRACDEGLDIGHIPHPNAGLFFAPTLVAHCNKSMTVWQDETFGPVAFIFPFESEDEVVEAANDTHYGLAAYVYTTDASRQIRVSQSLEYGMVGVNSPSVSLASAPFGGVKHSGLGREGSHYGIYEYMNMKTIHQNY